MVHSVLSGRQINKDGSCYQSFLESILNVLSELQKLACCRFARSESGLLRDDDLSPLFASKTSKESNTTDTVTLKQTDNKE